MLPLAALYALGAACIAGGAWIAWHAYPALGLTVMGCGMVSVWVVYESHR
jgi:hypothetical protein